MEVDFTQRWRERRAVFLQKQVFFNPRRHEVEKISIKLAAGWTIKHHYLGSFPSKREEMVEDALRKMMAEGQEFSSMANLVFRSRSISFKKS